MQLLMLASELRVSKKVAQVVLMLEGIWAAARGAEATAKVRAMAAAELIALVKPAALRTIVGPVELAGVEEVRLSWEDEGPKARWQSVEAEVSG